MPRTVSILLLACSMIFLTGCRSSSPLNVLVVTGGHGYNHQAFESMFGNFDSMQTDIKKNGKTPAPLFEDASGFNYDSIVLYNFNQQISESDRQNFKAILNKGVGLTVLHHAIAAFPGWLEYENIIGATYVLKEQTRNNRFYPVPKWKHGVDMNIKVKDPNHPVTAGLKDFTIRDETYKNWVYHENNHLLLATDNPQNNRQIAWTTPHPKTRVIYIQLGHGKNAYENKNYQNLVKQAINWSAGR